MIMKLTWIFFEVSYINENIIYIIIVYLLCTKCQIKYCYLSFKLFDIYSLFHQFWNIHLEK